jgi:hypothetical protein
MAGCTLSAEGSGTPATPTKTPAISGLARSAAGRTIAASPTVAVPPTSTPVPNTATIAPTATRTFTPVPTATPTATSTPTPVLTPAQPAVKLTGLSHYWQTWNNCGPATLAMNLSFYGAATTQADIAPVIRPDKDDKNVSPGELIRYAQSQGYTARWMVNGDATRLKALLSNGIPVIVETWLEQHPNDGMGHYRLFTGYDEAAQEWFAYDSYDTVGLDAAQPFIHLPYAPLDDLWQVFNRTYLVIVPAEKATLLKNLLGSDWDEAKMWSRALAVAEAATQQQPKNAYAWYNLGDAYLYQKRYAEAAQAFDRSRQIGLPWRMFWYQYGPLEAYLAVNRPADTIAIADATLKTVENLEEVHYWKGLALKQTGDIAGARRELQRAVALNATYLAPAEALANLPK